MQVKIVGGAVASPMHAELSEAEYADGYRLACLSTVTGDVDVDIPAESQVDKSVLALKGDRRAAPISLSPKDIFQLVQGWDVDPTVFKRYVELDPPTLNDNVSDLTRLTHAIHRQHGINGISSDFRVIKKLSRLLREADWKVTVTLVQTRKGYKLINAEAGDNRQQNYSIVLDIGTTTIFGQILNLNECKVAACPNGACDGATVFALAGGLRLQSPRSVTGRRHHPDCLFPEAGRSEKDAGDGDLLDQRRYRRAAENEAGSTDPDLAFSRGGQHHHDPVAVGDRSQIYSRGALRSHRKSDTAGAGRPSGDRRRRPCPRLSLPLVASYVGGDIVGHSGFRNFPAEALTLYMDIGTNGGDCDREQGLAGQRLLFRRSGV